MLYFCSNLCNFSCADRVNCQHLFLDFYLLCLPNIFAMFSCSFFRYFGSLVLASFSGHEILIRFSHSHNFITTTTFPQNNNSEKLKMSINSFLFCYVAHHTLPLPLCLLQLLLPPIQTASGSSFFHQFNFAQCSPRKKRQCDDFQAVSSSRGFFLKAASTAY